MYKTQRSWFSHSPTKQAYQIVGGTTASIEASYLCSEAISLILMTVGSIAFFSLVD